MCKSPARIPLPRQARSESNAPASSPRPWPAWFVSDRKVCLTLWVIIWPMVDRADQIRSPSHIIGWSRYRDTRRCAHTDAYSRQSVHDPMISVSRYKASFIADVRGYARTLGEVREFASYILRYPSHHHRPEPIGDASNVWKNMPFPRGPVKH